MGRYLYTIRDADTDEILFVGGESDSARFLDCDPREMYKLVRTAASKGRGASYHRTKVTREWTVGASIECRDCGKIVEDVRPNQLYCPQCAKMRSKKRNQKDMQLLCLNEDGTMVDAKEKQRQMQLPCRGCIYFGAEDYINTTCNYIFMVGHSRGCPGGAGCTKRKEKQ